MVEIGCPAEHRTVADHDLGLPTETLDPERDFGGQRFVRHVAEGAEWAPWRQPGFEARESGVEAATGGLAGVRFVRPAREPSGAEPSSHDGELAFAFVLDGGVTLTADGVEHRLGPADAVTVPAGLVHAWSQPTADLELLDVTLPAHP